MEEAAPCSLVAVHLGVAAKVQRASSCCGTSSAPSAAVEVMLSSGNHIPGMRCGVLAEPSDLTGTEFLAPVALSLMASPNVKKPGAMAGC